MASTAATRDDPIPRRLAAGPRLLFALCAALAALAIVPAAADACASLAGIGSFGGRAVVLFSGTASGPLEGSGGTETITLRRQATDLQLDLNHKVVGRGAFRRIVIYSGKAHLGNVAVDDSLGFSDDPAHGSETYGGPLSSPSGSASLFLDTNTCRYQVGVSFGVRTIFSGDPAMRPGDTAGGGVFSDRDKIPGDLHLIGGVGPDAYLTCPGDPLISGQPCYTFSGGWAVDFAELKSCGTFPPPAGNCADSHAPVGSASFNWVIKPGSHRGKHK